MSINQRINDDIIIEWNTTQQYKELGYIQQHGWILKTLWKMNQVRHRKVHTLWFHSYEIQERQNERRASESRSMVICGRVGVGKEVGRSFGGIVEVFYILIVVVVRGQQTVFSIKNTDNKYFYLWESYGLYSILPL